MVMSKSIPNKRLKRKLWLLSLIGVGITAGLLFSNPLQAKDSVPNLGKSLFGNYLAGRHAQFDSNPRFAIEYYRSVLKNTPNNVDLLRRIVMLLVSEGEIAEALPTAKHLLKLSKEKANSARLIVALSEIKNEN